MAFAVRVVAYPLCLAGDQCIGQFTDLGNRKEKSLIGLFHSLPKIYNLAIVRKSVSFTQGVLNAA